MSRYLITADTIYAGDPPRPGPTAFEIKGDRITWVGHAISPPPGAHLEVMRFAGSTIIPGLIDPHLHLAHTALLPGWVNLSAVGSPKEVAVAMSAAARIAPAGTWAVGWGFQELVRGEGRRLVRRDLDAAVPDRPALVIHSSFHSGIANSRALEVAGFGRSTPRWRSGELERNLRGEPNGRAWERAFSRLESEARCAELEAFGSGWTQRLQAAARSLAAVGLTHVGDAAASGSDRERAQVADLAIGITAMPSSERGILAKPTDALDGQKTGEGTRQFLIGSLKIFADGAERCAMRLPAPIAYGLLRRMTSRPEGPSPMALIRTLRPRPSRLSLRTGTLHYRPLELEELVRAARKAGFQVAIHALGNEAIEQAVTAFESAGMPGGRIEHAMFTSGRQAERMARLGIAAVMQPAHMFSRARLIRAAGIENAFPPVPLRRLIDSGVKVALSSDGPTAVWDPLTILRMAVERQLDDGSVMAADQAMTREEALRAVTALAAEVSGVGGSKGAIKVGRQADFVVLSGDPFDADTRVLETWVAGRKVWAAPQSRPPVSD